MKLALAAVLLVLAAAGLSSVAPNDYCTQGLVPTSGDESAAIYPRTELSLWPPGLRCVYPDGVASSTGDLAGFAVVLAGGAAAVWRRNRYAWATLIVLGLAGPAALALGFQGLVFAAVLGSVVAVIATRSLLATAAGLAVLILGAVVYLWDGSGYGWAALLALVAFADQLPVGVLASPRAEL